VSKEVTPRNSTTPVTKSHTLAMFCVGVVGVVIAFVVLSSIAGFIFEIIKIAVIVALIAGAFWLVSRIRR
jgi:uncharacterized membrane protein